MPERVVNHPKYGRGVVQESRYKGFELRVEFDDGVTRWVRLDEITESIMPPPVPSSPQPIPPPMSQSFESRRMIEAFRCGIVPHDCVQDFTFGRDREIQQLMEWLRDPDKSTLLLVGEYGTGKTHLLDYTYWYALHENFAVARVEMDPNEVPFHKPKRVYARLVQTFRFRSIIDGQFKGFRDFLKETLALGAFEDHEYFCHLIGRTSDENLWDWIEAREAGGKPWGYWELPSMYDYSTAANIYCYLLSALGWAARNILGLSGLLLIFDEAEALDMSYYYQFEKGLNFLKALTRTASDDAQLLEPPYKSYAGLDYCGRRGQHIPFLYRQPSGLKLLFAFTQAGDEIISAFTQAGVEIERARIDLQPLSDAALKEVFENICLLYDSAYDFLEEDLTIDRIFKRVTAQGGRTRLFVKVVVEALDLARLNHGQPLDEVLQ